MFRSNVGVEFGVMLREQRPHKPEIPYDIVRIPSLITYTDLTQNNIAGNTTARLLRCFSVTSMLKMRHIIVIGKYMNFHTYGNQHFRRSLENSFQSNLVDMRDTSGEKLPFSSVGITRLVSMVGKASNIIF